MPIQYERETPAFLLGCLLALLEKIQQEAIENINRTLADKYMPTASATPARVFDGLLEKSLYHLRKIHDRFHRGRDLENLLAVYRQKSPCIPERHDHQERADFMIGYYLKRQELWTSKEHLKKMEEEKDA